MWGKAEGTWVQDGVGRNEVMIDGKKGTV